MTRNPNHSTPRTLRDCTLRDCTFSPWADPIERPAPAAHWSIRLYVLALCVAAVGLLVYRSVA